LLLENTPEQYHHIVVDEVQDLTPLQLRLLDMHAPRGVMTLAGDTAQSLTANGTFQSWDEVISALPQRQFETRPLSVSYRSTAEIVGLGNKVLAHLSTDPGTLATPFDRHGPEPGLISAKSDKEAIAHAVHIAKKDLERGFQTLAVICKTATQCRALSKTLTRSYALDHVLVDRGDVVYEGGVAVTTVGLAKGLEFDVVIVPYADAQTYTDCPADARVFYVALTRAMHELTVLWSGQRTPLLD
jgi:DNA helicase-2/ATP-dependent DNA helicase PcrA